jgi:hypothetical protein
MIWSRSPSIWPSSASRNILSQLLLLPFQDFNKTIQVGILQWSHQMSQHIHYLIGQAPYLFCALMLESKIFTLEFGEGVNAHFHSCVIQLVWHFIHFDLILTRLLFWLIGVDWLSVLSLFSTCQFSLSLFQPQYIPLYFGLWLVWSLFYSMFHVDLISLDLAYYLCN